MLGSPRSLIFAICLAVANFAPAAAADLGAQLVGAWHGAIFINGRDVYTTIEYRPDGSLAAQIKYGEGRFRFVERVWGRWEIREGQLLTVTQSNDGLIEKKQQEIVGITKTLLILRDQEGHVSTEQR